MSPCRRLVQRRRAKGVEGVHVRAVVQQGQGNAVFAPHRRVMQGRVAHAFLPNVDSRPVPDQHERGFRVVVLCREVQRRPAPTVPRIEVRALTEKIAHHGGLPFSGGLEQALIQPRLVIRHCRPFQPAQDAPP